MAVNLKKVFDYGLRVAQIVGTGASIVIGAMEIKDNISKLKSYEESKNDIDSVASVEEVEA